jgi:putative MATE family efflux protein
MVRLAAPVLLEQLLIMAVAFVDQWLAGQYLQSAHLAAIGLIWYILWFIPSIFGLVAIGATALTARSVGGGRADEAAAASNQALTAGMLVALATVLLFATCGRLLINAMQLEPHAAELAVRYLIVLLPVFPAIMIEQVGIASLRGAGDTLSGFGAMLVVNVVNAFVGASLLIGWGPIPQLGWDGLAIGTASGHVIGAAIVLVLLARGRAGLKLRIRELSPDWSMIRRLLRIGVPGGVDMIFIVLCHLWFLSIINSLGTVAAAAHGLSVRIEALAYMPGVAFQVAAGTLAGQFLGAGDHRRAMRSVLATCWWGGVVMSTAGLIMYFFNRTLTEFFLGDQNAPVADTAAPLLQIVAYSMPCLAMLMIFLGALRGAGDTRWPLAFTFIGFIGVRIPLAYILAFPEFQLPLFGWTIPGAGWGVQGAWWAMVADVVLRSLLMSSRFVSGGWRKIEV